MEIRRVNNWVIHKSKVPLNAQTGEAASSSDPLTWASYDVAVAAVKKYGADGIGFAFSEPFFGIDLDDAVSEGGKLTPFARDIVSKCRSYTEVSPSGTGLHIILKGKLPFAVKTPTFEVYQNGRFFTVTQKPLGIAAPIREVSEDFIRSILPEGASKRKTIIEALDNLKEGERNNNLTSVAGGLRSRGLSPEAIFRLLRPQAVEVGLPLEELERICRNVGRYEPSFELANNAGASDIESFLNDIQTVDWLVPGLIAKRSIGFIAGLPESRKTWLMVDLAIELARGNGEWLGKFPAKKAKVLFVDQERFKGETQRRFGSVLSAKALSASTISTTLHIASGTTTRLNLQPSFDAFRNKLSEISPDVVIVDSFATFHTSDENNRQSIQEVFERIKQLRNEFGCTFIFISHENKGAFNLGEEKHEPSIAQMAGSVAIPAAAEFVFTVRKQEGQSSIVYNTKNTLAPSIAPFICEVIDTENGIQVRAQ